jgi:NAD(P) transhydrogenase subunit alpha
MPSMIPYHASQMYSKNLTTFLQHLVKEGEMKIDTEDEITSGTLVAQGGRVVHPMVLETLGQAPAGAGS